MTRVATRREAEPAAVLRARDALESTLRHEMLHVFVESRAAPGLPLWFREGLVEYLNGARVQGPEGAESALADRTDEAQARAANRATAARVTNLVSRHGLPAVLGWVSSGLPN